MEVNDYQLTIDKILYSAVQDNPDQVITYKGKETLTYSRFKERVVALAKAFVSSGLEPGDKVAVIDWDTLRYMECYYAIPMAGGTIHTVNIRYPPELIAKTVIHAEDRMVVIRDEFVPLIEPHRDLFSFVKLWIIYSESGTVKTSLSPWTEYEKFLKSGKADLPELKEDMMATTFYTSGTTGNPKGVWFTHRQIVLHTIAEASSVDTPPLSVTSTDVMMPIVPMFHVHAWGLPFMSIMRGMKYVLPGRYDYGEILEIIKKEGVTVSAMVPPILFSLLNHDKAPGILPGAGLRTIVGGGAMSSGLFSMSRKLGVEALGGYGMSETCPLLTLAVYNKAVLSLPAEERLKYNNAAGIPAAMVELRIVGKDDREVPQDGKSIGEIVVRAPWLTSGYVKDPQASEELWKGGWLHTGDLAVRDSMGYVRIVDRERDSVKSGGEFIPTILLEDHISTCKGVLEVAVVGKKDEKWGERPVAFVRATQGLTGEQIAAHLKGLLSEGRISKFWIPDEFRFVPEFQKTGTGKIDKKPLRKALENH